LKSRLCLRMPEPAIVSASLSASSALASAN
jgi:hypothetical protein